MNKTAMILLAALTGCSSYSPTNAPKDVIAECRQEAWQTARDVSTGQLLLFGFAGRKVVQHNAFERCMARSGAVAKG